VSFRKIGLENRAYWAYGISFVENYDLNIISSIMGNAGWLVSKTLNYPDMHYDGIVSMYLPFFGLGKLIKFFYNSPIETYRSNENIYYFCAAVYSVFISFLSFYYLKKTFRKVLQLDYFFICLFIFTTPFTYYAFFDFSSSDISCFFISCLLITIISKQHSKSPTFYLYWGLFLGYAFTVKLSFVFYFPIVFTFIEFDEILINFKKFFTKLGFLFSGFSLIIFFKLTNNYLKYGFFNLLSGYDYDFYIDKPNLINNFFRITLGPCGIVHQAPWLIVVFIIGIYSMFFLKLDKKDLSLIKVTLFAISIKLLYEIFSLSDPESQYGFRRYLLDVPFGCYIIYIFLNNSRNNIKMIFYVTVSVLITYSFFYFFWFISIETKPSTPFGVFYIWEKYPSINELKILFTPSQQFNFLLFKTEAIMVSLLVIFLYPLYLLKRKYSSSKIFLTYSLFYVLISLSNFYFNKLNVEKYELSGYFKNKVIGNSMNLFLYDEIISELGKNILIAKYKHDYNDFIKSQKAIIKYLDGLNNEIIYDPTNFKKLNTLHEIRENEYDSGMSTKTLMNYDSKTNFNKAFDY
jgi:hypothetical protein